MTVLLSEVRHSAYHDSIVLMQLQAALADLPGVIDAGAVMATRENLSLLAAGDLLPDDLEGVGPEDLLIVTRGETASAAREAMARVDDLLARGSGCSDAYRPRSLASAHRLLPEARWALVSVPGRFAAPVAKEALEAGLHVFLYSDNVSLADEVALKEKARSRGLLLMGPDCGTALINGIGFGFANRVRRGAIGLLAASGTGLQAVSCRIHELGAGISHAIGTGSRDLSDLVGGITTLQGLDLLARDPMTRVIVLLSKPPEPAVERRVLAAAAETGKPVVAYFLGRTSTYPARSGPPDVHFAATLGEAAELAVRLPEAGWRGPESEAPSTLTSPLEEHPCGPGGRPGRTSSSRRYLRGLFAGGTLALETLTIVRDSLQPLYSNLPVAGISPLEDPGHSRGHTVLDLGADEFTVGRPHPMIDPTLRLTRLNREVADPEVAAILLDIILGDGAHPDPAAELAPVISGARKSGVSVVAVVVGTDEDPQDLAAQVHRIAEAGAYVFGDAVQAATFVCTQLGSSARPPKLPPKVQCPPSRTASPARPGSFRPPGPPVPLEDFKAPVAALGFGLEVFHESLIDQGVRAVWVDWRPPAGGDDRLMAILNKMKG